MKFRIIASILVVVVSTLLYAFFYGEKEESAPAEQQAETPSYTGLGK
jgi:lipopolysaccharide export system protein LptC